MSNDGTLRAVLLALVMAAPILAGCLADDGPALPTSVEDEVWLFDGTYTWRPPVVHDGNGTLLDSHRLLDEPGLLPVAVEQLVPGFGAEPNIGVTSSGNIFVSVLDEVYRSSNGGKDWELVFTFTTPNYPETEDEFGTADPMLWVDPITDRVYSNHMHPAILCSYLAWSDDEGEPGTWTERPAACGVPYLDHQKVMTAPHGPNSPFPAHPAYPNALYICVNKLEFGTWCAVSHDGGITYPYDRQIYQPDQPFCAYINGHPAPFPDGTVAVGLGGFGSVCDRPATVVVTQDDGLTWSSRVCAPEQGQTEIDPDITVTPDGTAYMLYRGWDQLHYLMRSTDNFQTCDVFRVSPPDHTMGVFAGITSGDDGRIAMGYLATRDEQAGDGRTPSNATPGTTWHAYVTVSENADSENPVFVTQQVTPEEDPVQVGCVWMMGGGGGPQRCRNLLDFIDMVRDDDGRFYVAITDGCVPRNGCTGDTDAAAFQSRDRTIGVAVQDHGWSLFADKGVLPSLNLTHPMPYPRGSPPAQPGGGEASGQSSAVSVTSLS